jgi:AraC-like DNA-binding protein
MRKSIPVIRAAAMVPLLKWLVRRGRPVDTMLRDCGIGYVWIDDPVSPVPIRALEAFVVRAQELEGPDLGFRMITESSLKDIALLGAIALGSHTPREAVTRIAAAMPFHASHEFVSITRSAKSTTVHEYWNMAIDPRALHVFQQFVAGIVQQIAAMAAPDTPAFTRIALTPHPEYGLNHLRPWCSGQIVAAASSRLDITLPNANFDAPFRTVARDRSAMLMAQSWQRLQDGTLCNPARILIRAMLRDGSPTVENLASVADMSVRTLQRRLGEENLTFSDLLEQTRRDLALEALGGTDGRIGDIAAQVGYAKHSSFSRAVRRWTGLAPVTVRADSVLGQTELAVASGRSTD